MSEPADIPEAATLLPEGANSLIPQSGFTVAERTAVSLARGNPTERKNQTGQPKNTSLPTPPPPLLKTKPKAKETQTDLVTRGIEVEVAVISLVRHNG